MLGLFVAKVTVPVVVLIIPVPGLTSPRFLRVPTANVVVMASPVAPIALPFMSSTPPLSDRVRFMVPAEVPTEIGPVAVKVAPAGIVMVALPVPAEAEPMLTARRS